MRVGYFRTSLIGQESTQRITLEELESTRWMNNMEKRPDQNPRSLFFMSWAILCYGPLVNPLAPGSCTEYYIIRYLFMVACIQIDVCRNSRAYMRTMHIPQKHISVLKH